MEITSLHIQNYKALRDVTLPMSRFGCIIGENNAGKSSVLSALSLFESGAKIGASNFFDTKQAILIAVTFSGINEADLGRLVREHRTKVEGILDGGRLTLVRRYEQDGSSKLLYRLRRSSEARFSTGAIDDLLKGAKAGKGLVEKVVTAFPELRDAIGETTSQIQAREQIEALARQQPVERMVEQDLDLPTGIDKSIKPMLPEVLYVPAVKDLADDIKTSEGASFGKLLKILLSDIECELAETKTVFEGLARKLNRFPDADGRVVDERLEAVKTVESTVECALRDSFPGVSLTINIPPPELKSILSSAQIRVNDGVDGPIEQKGDGLKRALTFSLFRAWSELKNRVKSDEVPVRSGRFLLLFEEPELYLYPRAQQILFEVFSRFAASHFVMVTTHSPLFFGPSATATFIKLTKCQAALVSEKPFSVALPVSLSDLKLKDQFQIICYENNNAAFFTNTVVLVEGDSDYLVLPHLARAINPAWECGSASVAFVRINGKSSIGRYRSFFDRFATRVCVVADLDVIVTGFDQLGVCPEIESVRDHLISAIDSTLDSVSNEPNAKALRSASESGDLRSRWRKVNALRAAEAPLNEVSAAVDDFFAWEKKSIRLEALKTPSSAEVKELKEDLLLRLRRHDVYVLARGVIEDYYPPTVGGSDKPTKAQAFCSTVGTREAALELCDRIKGEAGPEWEWEMIFSGIFRERDVAREVLAKIAMDVSTSSTCGNCTQVALTSVT